MENKYRLLAKNTIIFTLGNIGSKIIAFLLVPLYTHYLTTSEYGIADLVFTYAQVLVPVLSLMITSGIFRFGLSKEYNRDSVLLSGITIAIPGMLLMPLISVVLTFNKTIGPWVWYLCAYVVLQIVSSIELCYLKVKEKNKTFSAICVLQTFLIALFNIAYIVKLHYGIRGYLLSSILSTFVVCCLCFILGGIYNDIKKYKYDKKLSKLMIVYSAPLIANELSWWIIHSCDKLMINDMIGDEALGLYSISARIPAFITVLVSIFSAAWGISTIKEYEETKEVLFYESVFKAYSFVNFLASMLLISITYPFMKVYVSDAFFKAWEYVPFLICSTVYASFSNFYGSLYSAIKKSVNCMYSSLISAIINVVLNYFLILWIGIWGAVISSAIACLIATVIRIRFIRNNMGVRVNKFFYINNIILVAETICVSLVSFPLQLVCSVILLFAFCLINYPYIKSLFSLVKLKFHKLT